MGHPIARATSYCLFPDTLWLRASKNAFKADSVKFANSLSPPPLWRKYALEVKAAKGLKRCQAKFKGVNHPAWIAQYLCACVYTFVHSSMHSFVPCWRCAYSLFHAIHFVSFLPGSTQTVRGVTEVTAGSLLDDDQWHDVIIKRDRHLLSACMIYISMHTPAYLHALGDSAKLVC